MSGKYIPKLVIRNKEVISTAHKFPKLFYLNVVKKRL